MHVLDSKKAQMRKQAIARRAIAHAQGAMASVQLAECLRRYLADYRPAIVAGYLPISSEIDPIHCMAHFASKDIQTALPVVVADAAPLLFRTYRAGDALITEKFKTQAPTPSALEVVPDLVLVPMLAFSAQGFRLGYGGGFYDRTIAQCCAQGLSTRFVGLAYDGQCQDSIPVGEHDYALEAIVTEQKVYQA